MRDIPEQYQDALLWFHAHPVVCSTDLPKEIPLSVALYLTREGALRYERYDPNLRYTLPEDKREALFFKLTAEGEAEALRILESRNNVAKKKAEEDEKDRSAHLQAIKVKKADRRHDFKVAAFTAAFTLLLEHSRDIIQFIAQLFR